LGVLLRCMGAPSFALIGAPVYTPEVPDST